MLRPLRIALPLLLGTLLLAGAAQAAEAAAQAAPAFPPPLESYADADRTSVGEVLLHRARTQPLNPLATALFLAAVIHTFFTQRFRHWAHHAEERHRSTVRPGAAFHAGMLARALHFLGEIEAVFLLWVLPLFWLLVSRIGFEATVHYLDHRVGYAEPVFVVVVMTMAATRPVLQLAEKCLAWVAALGGGRPLAWWLAILTLGPLLGSFITEPAAMTISALLLARQFYERQPSPALAYATLGLLFVNVSIGGTLTHFAAPPVLMVAGPWKWSTAYMMQHFGWLFALAIVVSNALVAFWFRRDFAALAAAAGRHSGTAEPPEPPVPAWITLTHLGFMAWAVLVAHHTPLLFLALLFFVAFYEVTEDHQSPLALRPAILVGLFLAGLVIHGGLQQWWIEPVLSRLGGLQLFAGALGLTAFNDNAAITYLATLVPGLSEALKQAVVAGAVVGGGLTVIANAPNPAGLAILNRFFADGVSPLRLLLAALPPTLIAAAMFLLLGR